MQTVVIEPLAGWLENKWESIVPKGSLEIDEFNLNMYERRMVVVESRAYDIGVKD
jgi:hypothetical protein